MAIHDLLPVDWKNRGYFDFLDRNPEAELAAGWRQWLETLRQITTGDSHGLPRLIDLAMASEDLVLAQSCFYLLGDAGGAAVAARIRSEAKITDDFDQMIGCCGALSAQGWLSDVPLLLDLYIRHLSEREANIIKVYIHDALVPTDTHSALSSGPLARTHAPPPQTPLFQLQLAIQKTYAP